MLDLIEEWHAAVNAGDGAGVRLEARRWFCGRSGAVVEQDARWVAGTTGEPGAPVRLATRFAVDGGRISRVLRHTALADALADAGLTTADEVTARR